MGHERVGLLPRRRRWNQVVERIAVASERHEEMGSLATNVLRNVRDRFAHVHADTGVEAAFGFLVALTGVDRPYPESAHYVPQIYLAENPSPLQLAYKLQQWVEKNRQSGEYATLAKSAAADVISRWTARLARQPSMFEDSYTAAAVWRSASSGSGFCEVARLFFAKFTERYLNYFLEREASAQIGSVERRRLFSGALRRHIDDVSNHAFETSKIAQSFAAGWYNRYASQKIPNDEEITRFLKRCFAKLSEELLREQTQ